MVLDDVQRGVDLEAFPPCLLEGKLVQLRRHSSDQLAVFSTAS